MGFDCSQAGRDAFRKKYLDLLLPALARIHGHGGSHLTPAERLQAVKFAVDMSLAAAAGGGSSLCSKTTKLSHLEEEEEEEDEEEEFQHAQGEADGFSNGRVTGRLGAIIPHRRHMRMRPAHCYHSPCTSPSLISQSVMHQAYDPCTNLGLSQGCGLKARSAQMKIKHASRRRASRSSDLKKIICCNNPCHSSRVYAELMSTECVLADGDHENDHETKMTMEEHDYDDDNNDYDNNMIAQEHDYHQDEDTALEGQDFDAVELFRRLQGVVIPSSCINFMASSEQHTELSSRDEGKRDAGDHDSVDREGSYQHDHEELALANLPELLDETAEYIIALQLQVDALQTLTNIIHC